MTIIAKTSMSRRLFMQRSAALGVAAPLGLYLAGCSSGDGVANDAVKQATSGTINFINIPGWIPAETLAKFQQANPGVTVKEIPVDGDGTVVAKKVASSPGDYALAFADGSAAPQLAAGNFVANIDPQKVPNASLIDPAYAKNFPWGVATDFGKSGIGYNKSLVPEPPQSWKEFFAIAPKYSGKVIYTSTPRDGIMAAFIALGIDPNSEKQQDIDAAKDLLIKLKPHLLSFKSNDQTKSLANGEAALNYDYDFSLAQVNQQSPDVQYVAPSDGLQWYVEGWVVIKGSNEDLAQKFVNFGLDPQRYAARIDETGAPGCMPAANKLLDADHQYMATSPFLGPPPANATLLAAASPQAEAAYVRAYDEITAS